MQFTVQYSLFIPQMDVKSAYFNAPIECKLYVEQARFAINGKKKKKTVKNYYVH